MARICTLKGKEYALEGPRLKLGEAAPDALLRKTLVDTLALRETDGKTRVFSVVPSLDTPVCAEQTKRFHEAAAKLDNVAFYTISCDLPTGMTRFCGAENIDPERIRFLSDYFDTSFGRAYGTLIPDLRVECRAVFVLDRDGIIRHAEYVPEIADHPDYDGALECAKQLGG